MQLPDDTLDDLTRRLRRIEGQVRGIQQMLTESRESRDIVAQVSAAPETFFNNNRHLPFKNRASSSKPRPG